MIKVFITDDHYMVIEGMLLAPNMLTIPLIYPPPEEVPTTAPTTPTTPKKEEKTEKTEKIKKK